jgi:hypothetical protein
MKLSLAGTVLILALFAAAGWRQQGAINRLRNEQRALVSQAAALGLETADGTPGASRHRSAERPRIDREAEAKTYAADLIQFIKEMADDSHRQEEEASMQKASAIIERMYRLDAGQIRILLDELRKPSAMDDETRQEIIGFAIASLSDSHPETAIVIFAEAGELRSSDQVIKKVLGNWAEKDRLAALDWVRKNSAQFPKLVTDRTKLALVSGCAHTDPNLAFQLITELGLKDKSAATAKIVQSARTPEAQSVIFSCLRDFSKTATVDRDALVPFLQLAAGMAEQGYEASHTWLAEAKPTPEECDALALGLSGGKTKADSGKWLEWMGANLPPDRLQERVRPLMDGWTKLDYRAAGEWLSSTADGAVKRAAVAGYAKTVAPYEPTIAAQWAETLPAGHDRDDLLRQIHSDWHRLDAGAAEAFAKKHGITP